MAPMQTQEVININLTQIQGAPPSQQGGVNQPQGQTQTSNLQVPINTGLNANVRAQQGSAPPSPSKSSLMLAQPAFPVGPPEPV